MQKLTHQLKALFLYRPFQLALIHGSDIFAFQKINDGFKLFS
jgi:hypothetical protein